MLFRSRPPLPSWILDRRPEWCPAIGAFYDQVDADGPLPGPASLGRAFMLVRAVPGRAQRAAWVLREGIVVLSMSPPIGGGGCFLSRPGVRGDKVCSVGIAEGGGLTGRVTGQDLLPLGLLHLFAYLRLGLGDLAEIGRAHV